MAKKKSFLTVKDQFCGAGGSSQGVRNFAKRSGGGIEVAVALNHWKLAIETHSTNFPDTLHDCTDISACDPKRYQSTDILITSPECTNHSISAGKKRVKAQMDMFNSGKANAAAERSRATMWDVCRFAEYHNYNAIIVENVVDARSWIMFEAWLNAMHILGYKHKCVYLNSMHCHPTPQSRDRMYIVFWKKGNIAPDLEYRPIGHCSCCGKDVKTIQVWKDPLRKFGKYIKNYYYRCPKDGTIVEPYYYAAFNCIDWSDPGKRIGDRKVPLAPNTIKRINYGINKYGCQEMVVTTKYHSEKVEYGAKTLYDPIRTVVGEQAHGLFTPFLVDDKQTTGVNYRVRGINSTVNTIHGDPRVKIVMPFIIKGEHTKQESGYVKSITETVQTQATRQTMGLVMPMITTNRGKSMAHSSTQPLTTQTTMINHGIITPSAKNSFLSYYYKTPQASHITEATRVQPTAERISLVTNVTPNIEDCFYRMIKPREVKSAMAFDDDYEIHGTGKEQVLQCGNAVNPPVMEWLIGQVVESLS